MKRQLYRGIHRSLGLILTLFVLQGQAQILDLLSTSPSVAYSLRQLKSTATRAIQVRRSSDNLTMDIGFTAGGDLDQVALLAFTGPSSAFVTTWYDQTGNGHDALQATISKQPAIVNAGVVNMQNAHPTCSFDGISSTMATAPFILNAPLSLFLVTSRTGTGTSSTGFVTIFDGGNNNTFKVAYPNTPGPSSMGLSPQDWSGGTSLQPVPQLSSNALFMYSALSDASSGVQYLNGGVQSHNFPGAAATLNGIRLFRGTPLPADNELPAGQLSEAIVFGSKLNASDRQLLECSESFYYSIQIVPAGLEFYITGTGSANACSQSKEDIVWQAADLSNTQATGNNLTKYQSNGNWDGGAASWNTVSNNGYFQFIASETNKSRMAGLSSGYTGSSYTNIQYAFYLVSGGSLQIYESGSSRGGYGTYNTGDVLKISVEANLVKYYKNGTLLYTSTIAPSLPLLANASINSSGGTITSATVTNFNGGVFTATALNAGASPAYQWMLNGSPVGTNSNTYTNTTLNTNDVVSCILTPNLANCSPLTINSNNITDTIVSPVNVDFSIQGTAAAASCSSVIEQVKWNLSDLSNNMTIVSTNSLTKWLNGSAWNGGAGSWNTVSNNGYFQFTASETNKYRMAGLSTAYSSSSFTTIQYAFYLTNSGALQIYESGSNRGTFGAYATGDVLKISVEAGTVKYYQNGTLLYISTIAPVLPLLVDVSIYDIGATVTNALVSNYNAGIFTATAVNAGASPFYQWLLNGSPVGTNSNTYTNTSLNNNDVVSCTLTPSLPGCSAVPLGSNTITQTVVPPLNMDFYIQGSVAAGNCNAVSEQVKWNLSDLSNNMTIVSTNSLSKFQTSGAWNGGAASWNTVSNNGYFQFTATETNKSRMGGLSNSYTSSSYTTIQYAFFLVNGGSLQIYESGSGRGTFGTYTTGDVLKISVEANIVKYYKNGTLLYISNVAPALPLLADVSIQDAGGTITNALVSNYNTGTFTATAVNAGASPAYQWLLNGSPVGTNSNTYTNTSLNNNDVVSCMLTPAISGCNATPYPSNTITETIVPPLNLDFSIQGTAATSSCNSIVEQVKWNLSDLSYNMTVVSMNSLSKFSSGAWDGGAASWNTVGNNGYFQFTATETNKSRMAGLSASYTSSSYTTIQYAFFLTNGGSIQIYESGSSRGVFGAYATGDILKISIESNVVKYYRNGTLLYISNVAPSLPMLVDVSIADVNGTIGNALVSNYTTGVFTAYAVNAGASPTYQWLLNGSPVGTNSNTYTNAALNNNDVVSCLLTPNISGCAATPVPSNTITDTIVPPLNLDFSIQGTPAASSCNSVIEQVKWNLSDLSSNMIITSMNSLSKFQLTNWNGGAASWNTVSNNGYFQFTTGETNKYKSAGLSASYTSSSYTTIQYAFYLTNSGALQITESGSGRGTFGSYAVGDILKISVEANVVKYYRNGTLLYISTVAPTLPLLADISVYDVGGTVNNAQVSNYNAGGFTAAAVNAGTNPVYQWLLNGSPVGTNSNTYTNTSLNNNDVVSCTVTPDLPNCSATPVASNTITETIVPPLNLDFAIQGTVATSSCNSVIEQVKWNLSNLSYNMTVVSTNSLSKFQSSNWDGGAASWNTVSNNGYFQFTATETNKARMAGLSASYTSSSYTTIQYAFYLTNTGTLQIYESGSGRGSFGAYATGDILKISVEANIVKYYKNGTLLYISTVAPGLPLLVDVSMYDPGGTITNALVSNYNTGTFTATAVNAGASPTYQWLLNGSPVGTNSNTYSNASLSNNDVISCTLTPNAPGCSAIPVTSNTITETIVPPLNLDFAIQGTAATTSCSSVIEQVKWNLSDLSYNMFVVSTNSLSKFTSGAWDGGAGSWNTVSNNGYFQFTATETNKSRMAGLSASYTSSNYTTIQYAIFLTNGGAIQIYESGSGRGTFGTYASGDVMKISVESNTVKYYKNGTLLYVSTVAPSLPLLVDVSIADVGGTITNALVSNYNTGTFTATAVNAGASPAYQWLLNGSPVGTNSNTYTNTTLNNNDVVSCMLTPNISGCNSTPVNSNTITETIVPPLGLDFAIQGTAVTTSCSSVTEQVKWNLSDLSSNMTIVSTNSLSKFQTSGTWNGGAASWNTVSNNGYFQFTATETNKSRMAGLSSGYTSSSYTTIQYAFYLVNGGSLQVYESGSYRGTFGTYTTGDVLKISVESNTVKYYKNGTLLYVSTVAPVLPLLADVSIADAGGTITNALVNNYNSGTFTATAVNAGASPVYQWLLNGSPVGVNSTTYTNNSLNNNDVVSCTLIPNITGCTSTPVPSNTITENTVPPLNLDFSIRGTAVTSSCNSVIEQVKWNLSNLAANMTIVSTNSLSKFQSNAWDGGAASWNTVSNNGYFQFTASETSTQRMAGLSSSYTSPSYTTIQYAFFLVNGGSLQIYESGSSRGGFGTYSTGDILKISVESNVVKYYKNGTLLYISAIAPTLPLLVDVSANTVGATISNALVSNYNSGTFTANATNAGATPNFQWMVNGSSVQTGTSATYTNTGLNNNDVVSCVLTPSLPGCSATLTYNSNTIKDSVLAPLNLDFVIQGVTDPSSCAAVKEQVKWKLSNLANNMTIVTTNSLSKFLSNGAWDGGAASWNTVSNNGYFQFNASETNTSRMAGLSNSYTSSSFTTIQYAFYLVSGGALQIYESGSNKGTFGTYATGDVLKISVEGNVVKYYQNGTLLRTSGTAPALPLLVDVSINNVGGTIANAFVSNSNSGSFVANTANAGASPTFQWLVNGTPVQTGPSASYSNASLTNNDVVTCTLTPNLTGCGTITYPSNTITYITAGNSTTWTGATSTSWFTSSNWSGGYPDKFTSAAIPAGTPFSPTIPTDASVYDVTVGSGATLTMSGSPNLFVYRNFTNNGTFTPGTGTVDFVGCSAAGSINGTGTETFYNVVVNTPFGITIGSGTQQVSHTFTFTSGIVTQNATLTFLTGSTVASVSDASHVNGVVTKVGNTAFTFPVGDNTYYRSIAMSAPASVTDVFTAQYIRGNPNPSYPESSRDATLSVISTNEYWMLNRTNGVSNVNVTLSWNLQSGTITSLGGLHVAGWSTVQTKWKDLGNGGTTGTNNAGTVVSSAPVTTFGAFTLASLTVMNVLPVQLLYFHATKISTSRIGLTWATASEQNSAYFTVERSADGIGFEPIGVVPAAGYSSQELKYELADNNPLPGTSYYRLRLTDLDGKSVYSPVDMVTNDNLSSLIVYPNPTRNSLYINFNNDHAVRVSIIDNTGRTVIPSLTTVNSTLTIDVSYLQTGLYFVLIDLENKTRVTRKILIQK